MSKFQILERDDNYWVTGIYKAKRGNRWFQAKVYETPSMYGVNECRVSKISISKTNVEDRIGKYIFFDLMAYNYDRGLDFNRLGQSQYVLDDILEFLNKLPKLSEIE